MYETMMHLHHYWRASIVLHNAQPAREYLSIQTVMLEPGYSVVVLLKLMLTLLFLYLPFAGGNLEISRLSEIDPATRWTQTVVQSSLLSDS